MTCPGSGDRSVAKLETENRSGFRTNLGTESLSYHGNYFFLQGTAEILALVPEINIAMSACNANK